MARLRHRSVQDAVLPLIDQGVVGTCGVLDLELLYTSRNGEEHAKMLSRRRAMPWLPMPDEVWDRAIEVQGMLAARAEHRAVSIPDLLVCATAERHGVTVLHYDADFDTIAAVTGQPTQWVVSRGTADVN